MKSLPRAGAPFIIAFAAYCGLALSCHAQQRSQVGYNISSLQTFFTDVVKEADSNFSSLTTVYDDTATSDSNGWPLQDAALELNRAGNLYAGTYTLSFNGEASVYPTFFHCHWIVAGDPKSPYTDTLPLGAGYNSSTNTTSAQMVVTGFGGNDALNFVHTARNDGSGQAGITGLHLYKPTSPGSATSFTSATLFMPTATTGYTYYDYFRFMPGTNWCLIQNWSDRVRPGHPADTRVLPGVNYYGYAANPGPEEQNGAIEYEIAWCNQLNKDLYINIPFMATDAYITNLAEAIAFGTDGTNPYTSPQSNPVYPPLNSNLHVYIEYSNEVWNAGFDQFHECVAVAQATSTVGGINYNGNYNGSSFSLELMGNYLATRITSTSNDFRAVFGDSAMPGTSTDPRIRPVLEWQYDDYNGSAQGELQFMFNWYNNGDGRTHVANPHPPSYYLWGGGGAVYYQSNFDSSASPDPADQPYTAALVNSIFAASMPETGTGDGDWHYRTVGTVSWAKYFGLHCMAYEGGMGVGNDGMGSYDQANPTAAAIARTDPRATAPEETSLNEWTAAGGDAYTFGTYDQFNGNPTNGPLQLGVINYTSLGYSIPAINNGTPVPGSISGKAQSYDYFRSEDYYGTYKGASQLFLVNASSAGTFNLTVNYGSGASNVNYLIAAVNGVVVSPAGGLPLPNNGDRIAPSSTLPVTLNAGLNGVRVYAYKGAGINLDGITLATSSGGSSPTLTSAVSRFVASVSGTSTNVDLPLNLTTDSAQVIDEPRRGTQAGGYTIVLTFSAPVSTTAATASLAQTAATGGALVGSAQVLAQAQPATSVTINLTGVPDAQRLNLTVTGLGGISGSVNVPINFLLGDATGDGVVNASDIQPVRTAYGSSAGTASYNLRADLNADGFVTSGDIQRIQSNYGKSLP